MVKSQSNVLRDFDETLKQTAFEYFKLSIKHPSRNAFIWLANHVNAALEDFVMKVIASSNKYVYKLLNIYIKLNVYEYIKGPKSPRTSLDFIKTSTGNKSF